MGDATATAALEFYSHVLPTAGGIKPITRTDRNAHTLANTNANTHLCQPVSFLRSLLTRVRVRARTRVPILITRNACIANENEKVRRNPPQSVGSFTSNNILLVEPRFLGLVKVLFPYATHASLLAGLYKLRHTR